jgi:hypothetical protein
MSTSSQRPAGPSSGALPRRDAEELLVRLSDRADKVVSRHRSVRLVCVMVLATTVGVGAYLASAHRTPRKTTSPNSSAAFGVPRGLIGQADTTSGQRYATASQASSASGVPVPACPGAVSYNSPDPGIFYVHFESSDLLLGVFSRMPQSLSTANPPNSTTSFGSEHFKSYPTSVAGHPAVGREWDGQVATRTNPDGTAEQVGAVYRSWLVWNIDQTGNFLSSSSLTISQLMSVANGCKY